MRRFPSSLGLAILLGTVGPLLGAGCDDPILLGPEHSAVVLELACVATHVYVSDGTPVDDLDVGAGVSVRVSYVPAHVSVAHPESDGSWTYHFNASSSPRDRFLVRIGAHEWELQTVQVVLHDDGARGDEIHLSGYCHEEGEDRYLALVCRDTAEPLDLLDSLEPPLVGTLQSRTLDTSLGFLRIETDDTTLSVEFDVVSLDVVEDAP